MAVACSVTENDLDAFQFDDLKEEKLQAMIPGTITDEKGTERLQAMIPGTITGTITDEKGKKTWEAKCSADFDAMIQTKHNGQVKVEFISNGFDKDDQIQMW